MITIKLTIPESRILKAMIQNPLSDDEPGDVAAVRRQVFEAIPPFEQLAQMAEILRKGCMTMENPCPLIMKTEPNWLVCQAHTKAECWSTLVLMLQLTTELEATWLKGLKAFEAAAKITEIRELQVRAPMRVVDLNFNIESSWSKGLEAIEMTTAWHVITDKLAEELLMTGKEIYLEFGSSHLEIRPPGDSLYRVRACTAAKHVEEDIFVLEDLQLELIKAFNRQPT